MIFIKQLPVLLNIFIEIPFISIRTSMLYKSYERFVYELICFDVKIFKWRISFCLTYHTGYWKNRKEIKEQEKKQQEYYRMVG